MKTQEWNFDGLVGPTHNYAGLSLGNVASVKNAKQVSYPKQAALQGLQKMKTLADMGLPQGVLAPQSRPDLTMLRQLGYRGSLEQLLKAAYDDAPHILAACYSASSMWTANAATVSPSPDTLDKKVHMTPANLVSKFHRSLEPQTTGRILSATFASHEHFVHHPALPASPHFGDEGAANHTRFAKEYGHKGIEFFVYGHKAFDTSAPRPQKFPARQSLEASKAIARLHGLDEKYTVFAQQNPEVIDQGVFHNDVIAVGNLDTLFMHEEAFLNKKDVLSQLQDRLPELKVIEVPTQAVSVQDAVESYLFNSQLIVGEKGGMRLICPEESRNNKAVHSYLNELQGELIEEVIYLDVKQSMQNGGGPACLRLRVALSEEEASGLNPSTVLTEELYGNLTKWVDTHYRDELKSEDLIDPKLVNESHIALDELTQIMKLGSVYDFQR